MGAKFPELILAHGLVMVGLEIPFGPPQPSLEGDQQGHQLFRGVVPWAGVHVVVETVPQEHHPVLGALDQQPVHGVVAGVGQQPHRHPLQVDGGGTLDDHIREGRVQGAGLVGVFHPDGIPAERDLDALLHPLVQGLVVPLVFGQKPQLPLGPPGADEGDIPLLHGPGPHDVVPVPVGEDCPPHRRQP